MLVYHHERRSRGSVGSNPGVDHYVYVRPETSDEEQLLSSLSGSLHVGHGDWRLSRDTVHQGSVPVHGGQSECYRRLRDVFSTPSRSRVQV